MPGMLVRFWGVRGSLATPGRATSRYGGNTSCVECQFEGERLIFDMGSGLRELGRSLASQGGVRATFFLSHYPWDHILGLPFFGPAFDPRSELAIYGATRLGKSVREILAGQMINPYFPVSLGEMRSTLQFRGMENGAVVRVGPFTVHARELSHPGGALGFRIEAGDAAVVYATDFEHGTPADDALIELSQGADMLIFDATYTPEEYDRYRGWGHSTWAEGVKVCRTAGVKKLILFHHEPSHDDRTVDDIVKAARAEFPNTDGAREGRAYEVFGGRSVPVRSGPARERPVKPSPRAPKGRVKSRPRTAAAKRVHRS
jgi:phosphoribosyl 1,2-cyclic phosphodiesterase